MSVPERHAAPWEQRYTALGRTQARYLWLLLALSLFFLALDTQVRATHFPAAMDQSRFAPDPNVLSLPFVPIPLSVEVVRLFGPLIILVLLRATLGSLSAAKTALKHIPGAAEDPQVEAFDQHPNVIDMAVYHSDTPSRFVFTIASFSYPAYLTFHAGVAVYLWYSAVAIALDPGVVPHRLALLILVLAAGIAVSVAVGLFRFWRGRTQQVLRFRRSASTSTGRRRD